MEHEAFGMGINTPLAQWPVKTRSERYSKEAMFWHRLTLGGIVLLSAFLNFFQLDQVGYGNRYYAAAVKSMLQSWHNLFFLSFDPGGFVTIDKPPLGFWLQALSAKIFGFSGWALLLPEAVAGIASVLMLYLLVRRPFGPVAGLLAALALAVSPISVAMNRSNNIDGLLTLAMLCAAWAVWRATEHGRLRWLLLGAVIIGLGFNIKTLEAFLVVPALGLLYLLGASVSWYKRIWHLSLALLIMLVVSLSWITIVDLTPASQRPYVGSSQSNSELELAIGYNGLQRLLGRSFGNPHSDASSAANTLARNLNEFNQMSNAAGWGTGNPGPLRLFSTQLGGQISWLLVLALIALALGLWQKRRNWPLDPQQRSLVLWGTWLLTMGCFFSVASFFHAYYMTTFAPSICALFGIGLVTLWKSYQRGGWQSWLLPLALALTALIQIVLLAPYAGWNTWMIPLIAISCLSAAGLLLLGKMRSLPRQCFYGSIILGILALLCAPTVWSVITTQQANGAMTSAGPRLATHRDGRAIGMGGGFPFFATSNNKRLETFLLGQQKDIPYLLATLNANSAAPIILDTNQPVMALGGFIGSDPILSKEQLLSLISNGTVRFFLLQTASSAKQERTSANTPFASFGRSLGRNNQLVTWIQHSCRTVPQTYWQSDIAQQHLVSGAETRERQSQQQLYDCSGVR